MTLAGVYGDFLDPILADIAAWGFSRCMVLGRVVEGRGEP